MVLAGEHIAIRAAGMGPDITVSRLYAVERILTDMCCCGKLWGVLGGVEVLQKETYNFGLVFRQIDLVLRRFLSQRVND